jgi:hypothetical protein
VALIPPAGQISSARFFPLSSPLYKNISVFQKSKSSYMICHPIPKEGRCATSSTWDGDAVDADGAFDESA